MRNKPFFIFYFFIFTFLVFSIYATENILLFGPPGSGKGTFSQKAIQKGEFFHICPGDMIRKEIFDQTPFGLQFKEKVALGEDLPEDLIFKMVKIKLEECLAENKHFILDGFPRSVSGYLFLKSFFSDHNIDKQQVVVVMLDAPEEILIERIKNRIVCPNCFHVYNNISSPPKEKGLCDLCHHLLEKRINDTDEVICLRLKNYREKISPIAMQASQDFFSVSLSSLEEISNFFSDKVLN